MKSLFRASGVYLFANAASAGITFLLLPVMTRILTPEDFGIFAMFALVVLILNSVVGLNAHGAIAVRFFKDGKAGPPDELRRFISACIAVMLVTATGALVLLTIFGPILAELLHMPSHWLIIAVLSASAQFISTVRLTLWQVQGWAFRYGFFQVGLSAGNAIASLLLVLGLDLAWEGRAWGHVGSGAVFAAIALISLLSARQFAPVIDRKMMREAVAFGVPLVFHVFGGIIIVTTDRVMLASFIGVAEAGIYMVALQIGMVLGLLADAFNRAFAPWLYARLAENDPVCLRRIVRGTYAWFIAAPLLAIFLGLLAAPLLSILVGEAFRQAAPAVVWVALGYAFSSMYYLVTNYVFYSGRTTSLALITGLSAAVNLLANLLLIPLYGAVGAAMALALAQGASFLLTWALAARVHPMPWRLSAAS